MADIYTDLVNCIHPYEVEFKLMNAVGFQSNKNSNSFRVTARSGCWIGCWKMKALNGLRTVKKPNKRRNIGICELFQVPPGPPIFPTVGVVDNRAKCA